GSMVMTMAALRISVRFGSGRCDCMSSSYMVRADDEVSCPKIIVKSSKKKTLTLVNRFENIGQPPHTAIIPMIVPSGQIERNIAKRWLFRCFISASIHGYLRAIPHESASYPRGYGHTHPTLKGSKGVPTGVALRQCVQQCLRLLQVSGVKPLGEP